MKTKLLLIALLILSLTLSPALAEGETGLKVTLPPTYENGGLNYPVLYLLPQDGYTPDNDALYAALIHAMEQGQGTEMIIVQPAFAAGEDPLARINAVVAAVDSAYRTIPDKAHRAAIGTGVGGYLAYALTLAPDAPFEAAVSIRGDFASEENPWLAVCGSIQEKLEALHGADENALNAYYTYMDAPVDDPWTDMKGSTDDLGALFIGYGTGSAFHEFTVRPGAFDEAFLAESASRALNRLTGRMLSSVATGAVTPEKTSLVPQDEEITVQYEITVSDAMTAHISGATEITAVVSLKDPKTHETLTSETQTHEISGAGTVSGAVTLKNLIASSSAEAQLSVSLLNTTQDLASATLVVAQEPVINGDFQQLELVGDWYFNYIGRADALDVTALTAEEYEAWSVVQPGLAWWEKGFGNINDETVSSPYGPDYFNFFVVGNAYYVKTFTVPEAFTAKDLVLAVGYVDDRCEVFLNGVRVGATGMDESGQPTGDTTWAVFSAYELDPALLNVGGENTIVVRAFNDLPFGGGGWYSGPIGIYSKTAFDAQYAEGANPRFYEESYESAHVAAANEQEGTMEEKYLIYLPEGYEASDRSYPTVYLLHQFNSDHTSYRTDHVDQLLDEGIKAGLFDEMIVVIPNSSENSWWTGEWEKMLTEELIPLIDGKYRTINDPRFRFTVGCSMGGQGAYAVALRNPDYFTGAVSFFGAFSYGGENSPNAIAAKESKEYLDAYTLYFICGNQDNYGFGAPAIQLHQQLSALDVAHRFFIENGAHDSSFYVPYFQEGLAYARANMYKSDSAVEGLLHGELALEGNTAKASFTADEAIKDYLYAAPASSFTKNTVPALNIKLLLEIEQNGQTECVAKEITLTADALAQEVTFDLGDAPAAGASVALKAAVLDRVVTLATAK